MDEIHHYYIMIKFMVEMLLGLSIATNLLIRIYWKVEQDCISRNYLHDCFYFVAFI
jgi:hypothetical protein